MCLRVLNEIILLLIEIVNVGMSNIENNTHWVDYSGTVNFFKNWNCVFHVGKYNYSIIHTGIQCWNDLFRKKYTLGRL